MINPSLMLFAYDNFTRHSIVLLKSFIKKIKMNIMLFVFQIFDGIVTDEGLLATFCEYQNTSAIISSKNYIYVHLHYNRINGNNYFNASYTSTGKINLFEYVRKDPCGPNYLCV